MESEIFNVYANALLELTISKNSTLSVREEIKSLKKIIKENNDFVLLMQSKNIKNEKKYEIIDNIFASCNLDLKSFLKVLVRNNLSFYIYDVLKETLYRFDDYLNIEEGILYISKEINQKKIESIKEIVEKRINKKIDLEVCVDKDLLGGFKMVLRNDIFDVSILSKINLFKKALMKE